MFEKLFYGDPEKKDFTENDLPATRPELFRRVLADRYGQMFLLNLLYVAALLPAIVWGYLSLSALYSAVHAGVEDLAPMWLQALAVWAPLWWITGPFTAGFAYVHGCWARDEACSVWEGYRDGVRDNWKQALAISGITALLPLLAFCSIAFYLKMTSASIAFVLPMVLCIFAAAIWFSSLGTVWGMMTAYQMPLKQLLKNAVFLTLGNLLPSFAFRLLTLLPPLFLLASALLFPGALIIGSVVVLTWGLLFGLSFNRLIHASYANFLTETYINARIEGLPTRIGLRPQGSDPGNRRSLCDNHLNP